MWDHRTSQTSQSQFYTENAQRTLKVGKLRQKEGYCFASESKQYYYYY